MEYVRMERSLLDGSVLLSSVLGGFLFLLGAFLTKYYFLEFIRKIHGRTIELDSLQRGLVQGVFSMVPYFIFHVFCLDAAPAQRHEISAGLTFLSLAAFFSTIILLSPKSFRFNMGLFNSISAYTLLSLFLSVTATTRGYGAIASAAAQVLSTFVWLRSVKTLDLEPVQDFSYIRGRNIGSLVRLFKNILYPFEIMLDYSLVLNTVKNKAHFLSFPTRCFISPYVNASLILLYYKFGFSLGAMVLISLSTFCTAVLLAFCSKRAKLGRCIPFYGFVVACGYFYVIIREQVRIAQTFSRLSGASFSKTATYYVAPQLCFFSLLVNTHFYSIGLRQVSVHSALITNIINLVILIGISSGMAPSPLHSILGHRLSLLALAMCGLHHIILVYYARMCNGKLVKDFAFLNLALVAMYFWALHNTD